MTTVVLIAESDPTNLRLLQDVCEAAGHEVITASEERGALDQLARRKPDLVVVDASLPASAPAMRGGLSFLKTLKSDRLLAAIPVLLTTGADNKVFADSNIVCYERLRALGCDHHELQVYPGYGHQDVFMGEHVARDCFPAMLDFIRRHSETAPAEPAEQWAAA